MGVVSMAMKSTELGLNLQDDYGRGVTETLFAAVNVAAQLAERYALATGREVTEVVDELSAEFELTTPNEFRVGFTEDRLRTQDLGGELGKD